MSEVLLLGIVINIHVIRAGEVAGSVQSVSRAELTQKSGDWDSSIWHSSTREHLPTGHSK